MTQSQYKSLTKVLNSALLSCFGIFRNIYETCLTVPYTFGGIGMPDLYVKMVVDTINIFLVHSSPMTEEGCLFRHTYEEVTLSLVLSGTLFKHNFKSFQDLIEKCCWRDLWENTSTLRVVLRYKSHHHMSPQRERDVILMDEFFQLKYSLGDLAAINRVRKAYRVLYLSDITNIEGTKINVTYRDDHQSIRQCQSKLCWPTEQVTPNNRLAWTNAIKRISSPQCVLPYTLGAWKTASHQIYKWFFDPTINMVFHRVNEVWNLFHQTPLNGQQHFRDLHRGRIYYQHQITAPPHLTSCMQACTIS